MVVECVWGVEAWGVVMGTAASGEDAGAAAPGADAGAAAPGADADADAAAPGADAVPARPTRLGTDYRSLVRRANQERTFAPTKRQTLGMGFPDPWSMRRSIGGCLGRRVERSQPSSSPVDGADSSGTT